MSANATKLRERLSRPGVVRVMGAHDALGARLAERAGFDAVWSSGLEISTSHGVPDANILTMSEFLAAASSMVDAVSIPVIADCDTGFGNSNNVIHMVRRFEAAGVAAVCIEDKMFPKVNSFVPGRQELAPLAEFVGKILAAKNAQRSAEFMVIARIEALIAGCGVEEALRRAHAYERAGADALLIHSKAPSVEPIAEFLAGCSSSVPIVVVPTTYPELTAREFGELGAKVVIYANHGIRAAIRSMEDAFAEILATDRTLSVEAHIAPLARVFELQGMPEMKADELAFLRTSDEPVRAVVLAAGAHEADASLKEITRDIPISMLDVGGKPLLQRQVEVLNRAGIQAVTVVTGHRGEDVTVEGVRRVHNHEWEGTGEVRSLLAGLPDAATRTLVVYGDVLFDAGAVKRLLAAREDVVLLLDRTLGLRRAGESKRLDLVRVARPSGAQRRYLESDGLNRVAAIGKDLDPGQADCEFTGLAIFSPKGLEVVRRIAAELAAATDGGSFHEARPPVRAGLTDLLQEMVDRGEAVGGVEVSSGWLEIHTFEDYRLASRLVDR